MEKNSLIRLETELRLGIPGASNEKKRVFSDYISGAEEKVAESKSPVVGWPPIGGYRRRNLKMYVKVSMDGAPFLRKIDLSSHKCYSDLVVALEQLFGIGEALKDSEKCEYVPIYEDKDGDWMLLGDVPWEMFIESCKRLRIMKRSDAKGIGLEAKDLLNGLGKEESL